MGYMTRYELDDGGAGVIPSLRQANDYIRYAVNDHGETLDECKWYDHVLDMLEISKNHTDVVFTLRGWGEENGDIWAKYFKDGKCQVAEAQIYIAPYDERFLK